MRRRSVVVAAVAAAGVLAGCAPVYVSPTGSDSGKCTSKQPCRTFARAAAVAAEQKRSLVVVKPGVYPKQTVPAGDRRITFQGTTGAKLRGLENNANRVTFTGLDVDAAFAKTVAFDSSGDYVTFKRGRIGNVTDDKGAQISGRNFTFDDVEFHDVRLTNSQVHNECVYAIVVPGMTVRNSIFHSCATMDLFFTYGTWWEPRPPAYGNVTIENNVFAHATMIEPDSWHYYSLVVGYTGAVESGGGTIGQLGRAQQHLRDARGDRRQGRDGRVSLGQQRGRLVLHQRNVLQQQRGQEVLRHRQAGHPGREHQDQDGTVRMGEPGRERLPPTGGIAALNAANPRDVVKTDQNAKARGAAPDAGALER